MVKCFLFDFCFFIIYLLFGDMVMEIEKLGFIGKIDGVFMDLGVLLF